MPNELLTSKKSSVKLLRIRPLDSCQETVCDFSMVYNCDHNSSVGVKETNPYKATTFTYPKKSTPITERSQSFSFHSNLSEYASSGFITVLQQITEEQEQERDNQMHWKRDRYEEEGVESITDTKNVINNETSNREEMCEGIDRNSVVCAAQVH